MSSLRDQLLKAGLSESKPVQKQPTQPTSLSPNKTKTAPKKQLSELERFYRQRAREEKQERQRPKKARAEANRLKKERNIQISKLINENTLNADEANERYNFVMGKTVKYTYVSEEQLEQLAKGSLALAFLKGQCRVISHQTAQQIRAIDDKRMIVQQAPEEKLKDSH